MTASIKRNVYCGKMIDTSAQYQHAIHLAQQGSEVAFHIHPYDHNCTPETDEISRDWCWAANYENTTEE
jgi:hypothetical protein